MQNVSFIQAGVVSWKALNSIHRYKLDTVSVECRDGEIGENDASERTELQWEQSTYLLPLDETHNLSIPSFVSICGLRNTLQTK
jgi:hypothetical protein